MGFHITRSTFFFLMAHSLIDNITTTASICDLHQLVILIGLLGQSFELRALLLQQDGRTANFNKLTGRDETNQVRIRYCSQAMRHLVSK